MAAGDLLQASTEVEFRGLRISLATGVFLASAIQGLGNTEQRVADVALSERSGSIAGVAHLGTKQIMLPVEVLGSDADDAMTKFLALAAAWAPIDPDTDGARTLPLAFQLGTSKYLVYGRPGRLSGPDLELLGKGARVAATAEFVATDPRVRSAALKSGTTNLGAVTGGLDLPHDLPHAFGTVTPGSVVLTMVGNFSSFPTFTFTAGSGGLLRPRATLGGLYFQVNISLDEGDVLTCDMQERTVVLNGSTSRTVLVARPGSTWFTLSPGENVVTFSAAGGDGTMLVSAHDAYHFG